MKTKTPYKNTQSKINNLFTWIFFNRWKILQKREKSKPKNMSFFKTKELRFRGFYNTFWTWNIQIRGIEIWGFLQYL
jgi:hypothetical protein